jgi:hypothetical protein
MGAGMRSAIGGELTSVLQKRAAACERRCFGAGAMRLPLTTADGIGYSDGQVS